MQDVGPEEKTDLEEEPKQEWSLKQFVYGGLASALLFLVAVGLLMAVFSWIEPGEVEAAIIWVTVGFAYGVYIYLAHRKTKAREKERAEKGLPPDTPPLTLTGTESGI